MNKDNFSIAATIATFDKSYEDIVKVLKDGHIAKFASMANEFLEQATSFVNEKTERGELKAAVSVGGFVLDKKTQLQQMVAQLEEESMQEIKALKEKLKFEKEGLKRSEQELREFRDSFEYKLEYLQMYITNFGKGAQEVIYLLEADIIKIDRLERTTRYFIMAGERLLQYAEHAVRTTNGDELNVVKERLIAHYPKQKKQHERIAELSSKLSTPELKRDLTYLSAKLDQLIEAQSKQVMI